MSCVPAGYNDCHRQFLQIMINRRMVSYQEAYNLFCKLSQSDDEEESANLQPKDMEQVVSTINKAIKRFNMEIRSALDEITCQQFYLFVNTVANEGTSKTFSRFSAQEMEIFKKISHEIITSETGCVSSRTCLNLNTSLPGNMSKSDVENLIKRFCTDFWLFQKDGMVYLSLLAIIELEPLLTTSYEEDICHCVLCKHIIIQGYKCDNCLTLLHLYCLSRYCKRSGHNCPKCGIAQPDIVGAIRNLSIIDISGDEVAPTPSVRGKGVGKRSSRTRAVDK